jgi:hypothetical protein
MDYNDIVDKWNDEADNSNQWDSLDLEEKVEYSYKLGSENMANTLNANFYEMYKVLLDEYKTRFN